MFLTDAQVLQKLSDVLSAVGVSNLPAQWASTIVPDAHALAYADLVAILLERGYSQDQVDSWDFGGSYEGRLAVYHALCGGAGLQNLDKKFIDSFDVREALKTVPLISGRKLLTPAGPLGIPSTGTTQQGDDLFQWPPADGSDPFPAREPGQPTRW